MNVKVYTKFPGYSLIVSMFISFLHNILTALYSYCRLRAVTSAMVRVLSLSFYGTLTRREQVHRLKTSTELTSLCLSMETPGTSVHCSDLWLKIISKASEFHSRKCVSHTLQSSTNTSAQQAASAAVFRFRRQSLRQEPQTKMRGALYRFCVYLMTNSVFYIL